MKKQLTTTQQLWMDNYKQFKKASGIKLTFDEWWYLTGLIDNKEATIEAEIDEQREDGKMYDETADEKAERRQVIKDLKSELKLIQKLSSKLFY